MFNWVYGDSDTFKKQQDIHKSLLYSMEQETVKFVEKQKNILLNSNQVLFDLSTHQLSNLLKEQKKAWDINKQKMKEYILDNNTFQSGVKITYKSADNNGCICNHIIFLSSETPNSLTDTIYENPANYLEEKLGVRCLRKITSIEVVKRHNSDLLYKVANFLGLYIRDVTNIQDLEMIINNHIESSPNKNDGSV